MNSITFTEQQIDYLLGFQWVLSRIGMACRQSLILFPFLLQGPCLNLRVE